MEIMDILMFMLSLWMITYAVSLIGVAAIWYEEGWRVAVKVMLHGLWVTGIAVIIASAMLLGGK